MWYFYTAKVLIQVQLGKINVLFSILTALLETAFANIPANTHSM